MSVSYIFDNLRTTFYLEGPSVPYISHIASYQKDEVGAGCKINGKKIIRMKRETARISHLNDTKAKSHTFD